MKWGTNIAYESTIYTQYIFIFVKNNERQKIIRIYATFILSNFYKKNVKQQKKYCVLYVTSLYDYDYEESM